MSWISPGVPQAWWWVVCLVFAWKDERCELCSSRDRKDDFFIGLGAIFVLLSHWIQLSSAEAIPPCLPSKGWSSELMAALAATCSFAFSKYSSCSKCICSSIVCWNGSTPTQNFTYSYRESIMLNEMSFKWEKGGVGVSPIVVPLWDWYLHDLAIKSIWTCYAEVI